MYTKYTHTHTDTMKYIVSFTTSPTRIHKCRPMLNSILGQTRKPDLILLNIPKVFERTGETYDIPKFVEKSVVVNVVDKDYGPGTKLIPTVRYLIENGYDPNKTRIIYLDDDIYYMVKMIETYEKVITDKDDNVWTATGFDFMNMQLNGKRKHKDQATIAEGYGSVCVKLSTFTVAGTAVVADDAEVTEADFFKYIDRYISDQDCRLSDDIILSNYYHKKNVGIFIVNIPNHHSIHDMWRHNNILEYGKQEDALHNGANGTSFNNVDRYKKVITKLNKGKERHFKMLFIHNDAIVTR